jgi:hypothetical protein
LNDRSLNIDETYIIEIIRNPAMSAELFTDKKPGESVTVLRLSENDAQRMRELQSSMAPYSNGERKASGSFGVVLEGVCLHGKMPAGEVLVDVFLQTSEQDGFFVFAKDLDLRKESNREGSGLDDWPDCL